MRKSSSTLPSTSRAPVNIDVGNGNGNGNVTGVTPSNGDRDAEFSPDLYRSMELYLPRNLVDASRDTKLKYMREVLRRYSPVAETDQVQKHIEYRENIASNFELLREDLHTLPSSRVFLPSFLNAFRAKRNINNESIRNIMNERAPGVYTFEMLRPGFCEILLLEVDNIENWIRKTKSSIMLPNTVNKFGVDVDDFGLKDTLDVLLEPFIRRICAVLFPDVGGDSIDYHRGYVVDYGMNKDGKEDFHVDDSEVTLNVCLGEKFLGGQLIFEQPRCEKHLQTKILTEKLIEIHNSAGCATIYRGCHRHGARDIKSGRRTNLLMWHRSSIFREVNKHDKGFKDFCEECQNERSARRLQMVVAKRTALAG